MKTDTPHFYDRNGSRVDYPANTVFTETAPFASGQRVQVLPGGELDHSFHGTVTRNDPDNFLVFVAEDGADAVWGMPTCFVYPLEVVA